MDFVDYRMVLAIVGPNIGGILSIPKVRPKNDPWYRDLKKAPWSPPTWVFAPVWTALYSTMGYASYLVYRDGNGFEGEARKALMIYGGSLLVNYSFTPAFFKLQSPKLAQLSVMALVGMVAWTANEFYKINPTAGKLLIPYLAWGIFASTLNGYVCLAN